MPLVQRRLSLVVAVSVVDVVGGEVELRGVKVVCLQHLFKQLINKPVFLPSCELEAPATSLTLILRSK